MINCPKCQVPNPDSVTVCAACGTALVGQQFAQALDQAMSGPAAAPTQPPPAVDTASFLSAAAPGFPEAPMPTPMVDPAQAQAEINRFMAEQRSRRRVRTFVYLAILLVAGGAATFFMVQSSRRKALIESVATFYSTFNKTDDDSVGAFYKCVVRARDMDIHKASDTLQLTEGLDKAFRNFPKTQSGWIRDKCIVLLNGAMEEFDKIQPPAGFVEPMEAFKASLKETGSTFERYAAIIERRKNEAVDEQEVREMNADFHKYIEDKNNSPKAIEYYNLIHCAVPGLTKMGKSITKPPDTQPLVEYIYNTCKADPKYADKLRKDCFTIRKDNIKKTGDFHLLANRMSGDPRDLEAINDCFRRANKGFAREEIEAVAKVYIKYAEARGKVREEMAKVKEKFAE